MATKTDGGMRGAWVASAILAIVGMIDASYLTWIKLANQIASCAGIGDCETVNTSRYSEVGGVPIALLGAAAYLVVLLLLAADRPGATGSRFSEAARMAGFGVTFAGTLYSAYLTYLELFVLKAVCPFCVVSAVVMALLFVLSLVRLRLWGTSTEED